jgi:hypothetical protein
MNAIVIHQGLFTLLGPDAMSYPAVTRILRETLSTHKYVLLPGPAVDSDPFAIDSAMTQTLSDESLASVRELAERKYHPKIPRCATIL